MRWHRFFSIFLFAALTAACQLPAAQDNPAPRVARPPAPAELARQAVLRRWPDATDLDIYDSLAEDDDEDGPDAEAIDPLNGPEVDEDAELPVWDEDDWTISVEFTSHGHDFEALIDDDGRINYIYEEIDVDAISPEIAAAAREAVPDAEIDYCDQRTDEDGVPSFTSFIVGLGGKEVYIDSNGRVVEVDDAPDDDDDDDDAGFEVA